MAPGVPPTLTFLGAARTVTGSKFLLEVEGRRVLVDCGLYQGPKRLRERNWAPLPVSPSSLDAVVLTHAHVDHCGYLPRLVKDGFAGPVHATAGTRALARIVLPDSGHLHEEEARYANRRGYSKHHPALPLYTEDDALAALDHLVDLPWGAETEVAPGVAVTPRWAGHILGAASLSVRLGDRRIAFSGDLGPGHHPLLPPPEPVGAADLVVVESTYGDESLPESDAAERLADVVTRVAARGGVVVIPAFAVDRTEVVLWHLQELQRAGRVPALPVFVDSPMASRALRAYTEAAADHARDLRPELWDRPLFDELDLRQAHTREESQALDQRHGPFVLISASGMATGGRILHHLAARLGDRRNAVVLVGFQAPGTRGAALAGGGRTLKMFGLYHRVRAEVARLVLSAHADRDDLLAWLGTASTPPEMVFVVHGEPEAAEALADGVDRDLDLPAVVARNGERVRLDGGHGMGAPPAG
ncbi:MAG: MBL fold metallo-hydrolase [Acidimicrobiales bacterium]|nr:MBL fold metallo-hydrolase [Acidimicrobiales bacterium]MCB9373969.1 MBL fold metallo-hydrolase [Microthrixaceae bacterium]